MQSERLTEYLTSFNSRSIISDNLGLKKTVNDKSVLYLAAYLNFHQILKNPHKQDCNLSSYVIDVLLMKVCDAT